MIQIIIKTLLNKIKYRTTSNTLKVIYKIKKLKLLFYTTTSNCTSLKLQFLNIH